MATEIIVGKRGRITIPACVRKKYMIKEGRLKIIETDEGILLRPKKSIWALFWDMVDSGLDAATVKEVKAELDTLRHQDEDE